MKIKKSAQANKNDIDHVDKTCFKNILHFVVVFVEQLSSDSLRKILSCFKYTHVRLTFKQL